jgi:hypothetical protein
VGHRLTVLVAFIALNTAMTGGAAAQTVPTSAAGSAPLATSDGETSGTQLQVTKLKRSGDSVMLQFVLINNSDSAYDPNNLNSSQYRSVDGVYLLDLAGKKKYEVVRDSDKNCLCSQGLQAIPAKSRANFWAKFPAPPGTVQKLGIVVPHFVPMDDVPLSP